ncbi:demethylmacrocin O-methyltransferase [Streptomyces sp. 1114.5]|uniref:class I SAM-dependent methyltransferase n=1 Tax=unclassified Streptomyces TaxID=2593676 RepID=UPI000BD358E9|nr:MULTISPECIES: class I SAM-dependent methyltransferase [unclassified Streptomyces]RKT17053.1 demethylmacrocin O-methyltransferase [Streptomyces sp. 1114.5]SOB83264.1 demethylmacrocin O-methyltransferase [Streptomyces sp. 1331.2]
MTTESDSGVAPTLDNAAIEQLILAADGRDENIHEVVEKLGVPEVCAVLADEIAFRADVPIMDLFDTELDLQLDVVHGDLRVSHVLTAVHGEPVRLRPGTGEYAAMVIEYDLTDLVRDLFGPAREHRTGRRRTVPQFEKAAARRSDLRILAVTRSATQAITAVLSGIDKPGDLGNLAARYYSDKWGGMHWFTSHYENHFKDLRDKPVRVLEIGVGGYMTTTFGGGSLRMWRRYFTRGLVYGLDIFDKTVADQPRVKTLIGSQNDPEYLNRMAAEYGPFDVIVDDGSHVNEHVLTSFRTLLPHLNPGGVYVIEDTWTAYAPGYGGVEGKAAGQGTSIGLVKELVDAIHHEEHTGPDAGGEPSFQEANVVGLHVYHNLAVIQKGINAEGAVPSWCPRTPPAA